MKSDILFCGHIQEIRIVYNSLNLFSFLVPDKNVLRYKVHKPQKTPASKLSFIYQKPNKISFKVQFKPQMIFECKKWTKRCYKCWLDGTLHNRYHLKTQDTVESVIWKWIKKYSYRELMNYDSSSSNLLVLVLMSFITMFGMKC